MTTFPEIITQGNFGWVGQIIPIILVLGLSWALAKKNRDVLFNQFPLMIGCKLVFPFLSPSILIVSFALFIMNILGSKTDFAEDVKEFASKLETPIMSAKKRIRGENRQSRIESAYERLKNG